MNLGPTELLIVLIVLLPFSVTIWGIVDAAQRPESAWVASGQNKTLWIVLPAVGLFTCGIGFIPAIIYLASIRPKVAAAQASGTAWSPSPASSAGRWAADPTGRHQQRWWDGAAWTAQVNDNGVPSTDPMD
jgi:hypothetical protein